MYRLIIISIKDEVSNWEGVILKDERENTQAKMSDLSVGTKETADDKIDEETDHLDEIPDGAGCVEIWEKISESRAEQD